MTTVSQPHLNYGIDAPGLVRGFFIGGLTALGLHILAQHAGFDAGGLMPAARVMLATMAVYLLGMAGFMIWYSRIQKLRDRDRLLDLLPWSGAERVLDVGCGRGLMLIGAAQRLRTGRAIGIDLWKQSDQANNSADATRANAALESVADRIEVLTADMRKLPFPAAHFDVVVSNWTIHNLKALPDRQAALAEIVRVLRPGGRLLINDIVNQREYAAALEWLGLQDLRCHNHVLRDAVFKAISFGSFAPAAVTARKPT